MVLNIIFQLLALSNDAIIDFKQNKEKKDINNEKLNLERNLKIRFIFYMIISFIFLLFFWYYISIFGAVYINTQYLLLKDTLLSFGLSFFDPFFFNLIPGIFRIVSLSDP